MESTAENPSQTRAKAYLGKLQAQTYQALGLLPPPRVDLELYKQITEELGPIYYPGESPEQRTQRVQAAVQDLLAVKHSSPFEDPALLGVMQRLASHIEDASAAHGWKLESRPVLGTLPTGLVNALTYGVPGTREHLVLFEPMLFTFASLLSKAIAQSFPVKELDVISFSTVEPDIEAWVRNDGRALKRFREVMFAYVVRGHPAYAPPYYAEAPYNKLADAMRISMEFFVMGHEYGHVLLGHLADSVQAPLTFTNESEAIAYSWQQEYAADQLGFLLSAEAMRASHAGDLSFALAGADFFFSATEVMDSAVSILSSGEEFSLRLGNHPPASLRQSQLHESLKVAGDSVVAGPQKLVGAFDYALALLWAKTRPRVRNLHAKGIRPAATWLQRLEPRSGQT